MNHNTCNFAQTGHAFMKRALYLSTLGGPRVSPNPFVGAVIEADGRIIGEGYHRQFGGPHAEVNAVASVSGTDRPLLRQATMYVTIEPCSHFGKTPPCADLIIREGIPRVVVAAPDPFLKNYESGIEKLRRAGVDVEVGLMRREAEWINRRFFTAHTLRRPFILLKWAMSADGFMAGADGKPVKFSTPFTQVLMHRERAMYDAIMVGSHTVLTDNPSLTCRLWPCRDCERRPVRITFESSSLKGDSLLEKNDLIKKPADENLSDFLQRLYKEYGITSLMVEGGRKTLELFIGESLFDEVRVEMSDKTLGSGLPAPDPCQVLRISDMKELPPEIYGSNTVKYFVKNY